MIWQPTMRIWAGEEVKIDEKELEPEPMQGIETAEPTEEQADAQLVSEPAGFTASGPGPVPSGSGSGAGSAAGEEEGEVKEKENSSETPMETS